MLTSSTIDYCLTPGIYVGDGCPHRSDRYSTVIVLSSKMNDPTWPETIIQVAYMNTTRAFSGDSALWYRGIIHVIDPNDRQYTPNFENIPWAKSSLTT